MSDIQKVLALIPIELGMHFLITGHTGFKGSWLTLLLKEMGHRVSGYSLGFEKHSLYALASLHEELSSEGLNNVLDFEAFSSFAIKVNPDIFIHFAAQSSVRESYRNPLETYDVNVGGTSNFLKVVRRVNKDAVCLVITTDKVYLDLGRNKEFGESDPLMGSEPYGQSKAIADLLSQYWMSNQLLSRIAIARAGNVIGGGDVSPERLMPELIQSYSSGKEPRLRFPNAVRPWQHVLDCLNGYLTIVKDLTTGGKSDVWNIGPDSASQVSVQSVQERTAALFGKEKNVRLDSAPIFSETDFLALNSEKIRRELGWSNKYDLETSISETVSWHLKVQKGESPREVSINQIQKFLSVGL